MLRQLKLLQGDAAHDDEGAKVLAVANDADVSRLDLDGVDVVELQFPRFTDGRAYSQAYLLRRRRKFSGDIRATGDVLVDQLVQMQRTGFSSAVLRADKDVGEAKRQFERYAAYYQADAGEARPHFARAA